MSKKSKIPLSLYLFGLFIGTIIITNNYWQYSKELYDNQVPILVITLFSFIMIFIADKMYQHRIW